MPNYYTSACFQVPINLSQYPELEPESKVEKFYERMNAIAEGMAAACEYTWELDDSCGLNFDVSEGGASGTLFLTQMDYFNPEKTEEFMWHLVDEGFITERFEFSWANTCSKPVVDGFGGGKCVIDPNECLEHDVIVEVEGGVAEITKKPEGLNVHVIDWDNYHEERTWVKSHNELSIACTRNEAGQHFTEFMKYWQHLEDDGLIKIHRPRHTKSGIDYDQQYWTLEITPKGLDELENGWKIIRG